ncbi:DNA repair protein RadC [Bartonella sp. DGB1]|uniref:RadC family protein n=1 Tax=Bartonella sp. DGB1 TaxID=3239807 RepID=UPI003525251A
MKTKILNRDYRHGHRLRLKQKFINAPDALPDYELLELLLFSAIPRKDTKQIAKILLKKFKSLEQILAATEEEILEIPGCGKAVLTQFKIVKEFIIRCNYQNLVGRDILKSWDDAELYFKALLSTEKVEKFYVTLLNNKRQIILNKLLQTGSIDQVPVIPQDVLSIALIHKATGIIIAHNHPSGDPSPSEADIIITEKIKHLVTAADIEFYDHIIIGRNKIHSMCNNITKPYKYIF